ncbi:WD40 repeat-like protein [Steccherinum ochraceum]|uniref:WD40 repeat-like protein n=1 Tax=Steccherinum ochraceum TaxID=92696 RepID=A0A4R0R9Z2_9APHY|nr:WD40 repeat-like protein [Steccherinum ochraceum]
MSFKLTSLYPCNPVATRGQYTKLSSSKDKIIYTNGRTVIIRDLKNPSQVIANSGHVQPATVARISPTGYYCASADAGGTVRVWDLVGEDQVLKAEYKVLSGRINDLEWDGESKRIITVGDGRDKFGHAFMMDTGSSTGEIAGHSKVINAVSIRHQRPFRAATAGDDATIIFHQGVPFKYDKTINTHTKFVQDVRYASSGDHFASVGSDAKVFVYDGKTGETLAEFTDSPHTGSIYASSWSPDSKSIVTSSADCTVKLWDVETKKAVTTWNLRKGVSYQQVGNTWTPGDDIVSLSISGDLNVFDKRAGDKPARVLQAPTKAISSAIPTPGSDTFVVGTNDGRVLSFSDSEYSTVEGSGHASLVSGLGVASSGEIYSAGLDDTLREIDLNGKSFTQASYTTASQPKSLAIAKDNTVFLAEVNGVEAVRSNQKLHDLKTSYTPSSVAATSTLVAVGGEDNKVHLYDWDGKALKESGVLEGNKGVVGAVAFNPDGNLLAAGDSTGKIVLFDVQKHSTVTSRWSFHSARIHSLAWTPDGKHCASGSLDTHIYIWSVDNPVKNIAIKNAAPNGVSAVFWLGDKKLAGTGADGCARTWDVTFHP